MIVQLRDTLTSGALNAVYNPVGADAGFGGRDARAQWTGGVNGVPTNLATLNMNHPVGTPVELYGYSLELASDLPADQVLSRTVTIEPSGSAAVRRSATVSRVASPAR